MSYRGLKRRVLVFPGGTEIGLEIWKSLKDCKDISLYSAGSGASNHASYVYKNNFIIPDVNTDGWIEELNKVLEGNKIDYIFPAHDFVLWQLLDNKHYIHADLISSPKETCRIALSKLVTYEHLQGVLPIPKIYKNVKDIENFPVFLKPDKGHGSQGANKANSLDELTVLLREDEDLVISEYLEGKEYTVDCFSDREKGLLFCGGRERVRIRMGTSMNSYPVDKETSTLFKRYAEAIDKEMDFHGAWFFQLKQDSTGEFKLLEVNPRVAGTMALHRAIGVNFPLLSIYEKERVDIDIMVNSYDIEIDRALVNRYKHNIKFNKVYVDLDDTLLIHNTINVQLLSFLYQTMVRGSKVVLLSKSLEDIDSVLKKWRIGDLFDEVVWLKEEDKKSEYISPEGAIYIDDSFSQRKEVAEKHNIPTFDSSMVELLIDWTV